jgi:LysM repeat protein
MKKWIVSLAVAIFIAAQVLSPAAAASSFASTASDSCGDTYTVQRGDYLSKIAQECGTTLAELIALNPQISNPSRIYAGQVIRLTGDADYTLTQVTPAPLNEPYIYYYPAPATSSGYRAARVALSTTRASAGETITITVRGFPANADIDYRIGQQDDGDFTALADDTTDEYGTASASITIPSDADEGEYWVVMVLTTNQVDGAEAYSSRIYITG